MTLNEITGMVGGMNLMLNIPMREHVEQDRLAVLYEKIERERQARVRENILARAVKALNPVVP